MEEWQAESLAGVRGRVLPRGSLHVTVAFLGHRPSADVSAIETAVGAAVGEADARAPALVGGRYRETRSVGMLVLDDLGGRAAALCSAVQLRLTALGVYEPERRPWLPHLTVLRFRTPPRLHPTPPALEPFAVTGLALFRSLLGRDGARYDALASWPLERPARG